MTYQNEERTKTYSVSDRFLEMWICKTWLYWLATQHGTVAGGISGNSKRLHPHSDGDLYYGDCVRLVR